MKKIFKKLKFFLIKKKIIIICLILIYFINLFKFKVKKKIKNEIFNIPLINFIRNLSLNSFELYWNNCLGFSEIQLNPISCIESNGFPNTLIESIETFLLLNETKNVENIIYWLKNKNFKCTNINWISIEFFWGKVIGSFIGSYLLSNNSYFLDLAENCTLNYLNLMDNSLNYPFKINLNESKFKKHSFTNSTVLTDIIIGVPELISLYKITNKNIYFENALQKLSDLPNLPFNQFWKIEFNKPIENFFESDYYNFSFLYYLSLIELIYPMKFTKNLIDLIITNKTFNFNFINFKYLKNLIKLNYLNENNLKEFINDFLNCFLNKKINNFNYITCLDFDTSIFEFLDTIDFPETYFNLTTNYNYKGGLSNICLSNDLNFLYNSIQSSELFSNWFNFGIIKYFSKNFIQNFYGHILFLL